MTVKELIEAFEGYYGLTYSPLMRKVLTRKLQERFRAGDLNEIFDCVIETHSAQYKSLPDVAVILAITPEIPKIECPHCLSTDRFHYYGCKRLPEIYPDWKAFHIEEYKRLSAERKMIGEG